MSKIKNYDISLYPSIYDAVLEILDRHLITAFGAKDTPIYGRKALDEICFLLAENDIQHSYTILPVPSGEVECDEIISFVWYEPGAYGHEVWYSCGKSPKFFRANLLVAADNIEQVEDWISSLDYLEVRDWSVDEV